MMTSVNPSSLFFATAQSPMTPSSAPSPASSKEGPSRKRPRTDFQSSEERKEARAERNRIAAQVSRDRRKAEFHDLRDRVTSLERENAQLRAASSSSPSSSSSASPAIINADIARENRELKERVRVLETALATLSQNVASALQGVSPTQASQQTTSTTASSNASESLVEGSSPSVSTRHLARVACVLSPSLGDETSLPRVDPAPTSASSTPRTSQSALNPTPSHQPTPTQRTGSVPSSTQTPTSPRPHPPPPLPRRVRPSSYPLHPLRLRLRARPTPIWLRSCAHRGRP